MIEGIMVPVGMFVLGILTTWFWRIRNSKEKKHAETAQEHKELLSDVNAIKQKLAVLEAGVLSVSTIYQAILIKELTHFHTPKTDALLKKLGPPNVLTEEEEAELYAALEQRMIDQGDLITESERGAAKILPEIIRRARAETKAILNGTGPPALFKIISYAPVEEEIQTKNGG